MLRGVANVESIRDSTIVSQCADIREPASAFAVGVDSIKDDNTAESQFFTQQQFRRTPHNRPNAPLSSGGSQLICQSISDSCNTVVAAARW